MKQYIAICRSFDEYKIFRSLDRAKEWLSSFAYDPNDPQNKDGKIYEVTKVVRFKDLGLEFNNENN